MEKEMTSELMHRIEHALGEFPELSDYSLTVGVNHSDDLHGSADSRNMTIRLNPRLKGGVTYATIGHELTHLLQKPGLGIVPYGEEQCDIWTLARSDLFLDDVPFYLCADLWKKRTWPNYAITVRSLCVQAIQVRQTNRRYKAWLEEAIHNYVNSPVSSAGHTHHKRHRPGSSE
jgi:hypothetical protein